MFVVVSAVSFMFGFILCALINVQRKQHQQSLRLQEGPAGIYVLKDPIYVLGHPFTFNGADWGLEKNLIKYKANGDSIFEEVYVEQNRTEKNQNIYTSIKIGSFNFKIHQLPDEILAEDLIKQLEQDLDFKKVQLLVKPNSSNLKKYVDNLQEGLTLLNQLRNGVHTRIL